MYTVSPYLALYLMPPADLDATSLVGDKPCRPASGEPREDAAARHNEAEGRKRRRHAMHVVATLRRACRQVVVGVAERRRLALVVLRRRGWAGAPHGAIGRGLAAVAAGRGSAAARAAPRPGSSRWFDAATNEHVRDRISAWAESPSPLLQALVAVADGVAWTEAALPAAIDSVLMPFTTAVDAVDLELCVQTTQQTTQLTVTAREHPAQRPIGDRIGGLLFVVHIGDADVFNRPDFEPHCNNTYFLICFSDGDGPYRATLDTTSIDCESTYPMGVLGAPSCTPFTWGVAQYELDLGLRVREGDLIRLEMQFHPSSNDASEEEDRVLRRLDHYYSDAVRGSLRDGRLGGSPWVAPVKYASAPAWPAAALVAGAAAAGSRRKAPIVKPASWT